ncbi:hypothetical protein ABH999_000745 [Bradyrhizobium yuanmingense]
MTVALHPSIDNGIKQGSGNFAGGTLVCKCKEHPVVAVMQRQNVTCSRTATSSRFWTPFGNDPALHLQGTRRARVWTHRK